MQNQIRNDNTDTFSRATDTISSLSLHDEEASSPLSLTQLDAEWDFCKEKIRSQIPEPFYDTFIAPLISRCDDGKTLHLFADPKLIPHLHDRYLPVIRKHLLETRFQGQLSLQPLGSENRSRKPAASRELPFPALTLSPFIAHPENQTEIDRLLSASFPYSVTTILGPSGSGKTHLARQIAVQAAARNMKSHYLTTEEFLLGFTGSLRDRSTAAWKHRLRENELLILDDFQYLKRTAERTQEELRLLVDVFASSGKMLLLVSDTPLQQMQLNDDLFSRIAVSAPVSLLIPNREGRIQILRDEFLRLGTPVEEPLLAFLADRIHDDIRKLKAAAFRLHHSPARGIENAKPIVDDLITRQNPTITPQTIVSCVAEHFRIHPDAIRGPAREKGIALARHVSAYLCVELLRMKLTDTASVIGRRDHGAVIHARKKIEDLIQGDLFFSEEIKQIRLKIEKAPLCSVSNLPK